MSDTDRIENLERQVQTLQAEVNELRRLLDNLGDALRPRKFDHAQVRLDKFDGERHG